MSDPKHLKNDILKIPPKRFDENFRRVLDASFLMVGQRYQEMGQMPYSVYGQTEKSFVYKYMAFTPLRLAVGGVPFPSVVHATIFSAN